MGNKSWRWSIICDSWQTNCPLIGETLKTKINRG